jgi:hypothetical protein
MSFHKFFKLREVFQGDLNRALVDGIVFQDFMDWPCNCNCVSKIDGNVPTMEYRNFVCSMYKATWRICNEPYVGQTQQKLKDRMGQHINDIKKLVTRGIKSGLFCKPRRKSLQERSKTN